MCQVIGERLRGDTATESYFTVGLLSTVDAFLDMELGEVVNKLSLSDELVAALLAHHGLLGLALKTATHYERAEWEQIEWSNLMGYGLSQRQLGLEYRHAIEWVQAIEEIEKAD